MQHPASQHCVTCIRPEITLWPILAAALLAGCGAQDEYATAISVHAPRRASIRSSEDANVCRGPWAMWHPTQVSERADPACGVVRQAEVQRVPVYAACRHRSFGIAFWQRVTSKVHRRGDIMAEGRVNCEALGSSSRQGWHDALQACFRDEKEPTKERYGPDARATCYSPRVVDCRFAVFNTWFHWELDVVIERPVYHERVDDPVCPESGQFRDVEVAPPQYASCTLPNEGAVGADSGFYTCSAAGLSRDEVARVMHAARQEPIAVCLTADAEPLGILPTGAGAPMVPADAPASL